MLEHLKLLWTMSNILQNGKPRMVCKALSDLLTEWNCSEMHCWNWYLITLKSFTGNLVLMCVCVASSWQHGSYSDHDVLLADVFFRSYFIVSLFVVGEIFFNFYFWMKWKFLDIWTAGGSMVDPSEQGSEAGSTWHVQGWLSRGMLQPLGGLLATFINNSEAS